MRAKVAGFTSLELISCHVAAGPGRYFVRRLADLLGIRVFASSRSVGPAHLGGTYLLDFGYCPESGRDLPGYEAAPVAGLTTLLASRQPYVSVTFTHGYIGTQANQQQPQDIYVFGSNFTDGDTAISSVTFRQKDDDGNNLFDEGGFQGNDVVGELVVKFSGNYGENGESEAIFPGFLNFRETPGGKIQVFGFIPYNAPYFAADYPTNPDQPYIESGDMFDATGGGGTYSYIDDGVTAYTEPSGYNAASGYTFGGITQWTAPDTSLPADNNQDPNNSPTPNWSSNPGYTIYSGGISDYSSNIGLVVESKTTSSTWEWGPNKEPSQHDSRQSDTNAALTGLLDALNSYLTDTQPVSVSSPTYTEAGDSDPGTDRCELDYAVVLPTSATAKSSITYDFEITPGANIVDGVDWVSANTKIDNVVVSVLADPGADPLVVTSTTTYSYGGANELLGSGYEIPISLDGTITVPQGVTGFDVCVDVLLENVEESAETISVTIGAVSGEGTIYDDDNPVSINNITVNEVSPYVVFTVTAASGVVLDEFVLADGTATNIDDNSIEYWNESSSNWVTFTTGSTVTVGASGAVLVRTALADEQESALDNGETFTLQVGTSLQDPGAGPIGTATIKDDGTGTLYPDQDPVNSTTPAVDNTSPKDDDTAVSISVNDVTVNEGSPYAVFTITGSSGTQITSLAISDGDSSGNNKTNGLSNNQLEYWNGTGWTLFENSTPISIGSSGAILVRVSIADEQDSYVDDGEKFQLTVTPATGSPVVGTGTIRDDGTGTLYPDDPPTNPTTPAEDTSAKDNDAGGPIVEINDVVVNEASDYAINIVSGQNNMSLSNLVVFSPGDTIIQNFNLKIYDYSNSQWTDFVAGTTQLNEVGELLVRTTIIEERDDERDNGEVFTLSVNPTGTVTIVDDGSGTIFTGAVNPVTGEAETTTTGLDNDGYEIKANCGWETSTFWQGDTFVTQHYNTGTGQTVMTWETDGYTTFELL